MDEYQCDQNTFLDPNDEKFWAKMILVAIFHDVFVSKEDDQND